MSSDPRSETQKLQELVASVVRAQLNANRIIREDEELIAAYLDSDELTNDYVSQAPDEGLEEKPKGPSELYKFISILANATDLPEPDPMVLGLAAMGEAKWGDKYSRAAWAIVSMQYGKWFRDHGHDLSKLQPPNEEIQKPTKTPLKEVSLDKRTLGFVVRFRYLPLNEHTRVRDAIRKIPGRQFHDGTRFNTRMKEPHWLIPGDDVSANMLRWYLYESQNEYNEKRDSDFRNAAYFSGMLEDFPWDIKDGVKERIEYLIERADKMVPLSEGHQPSPEFQLSREYISIDGMKLHPYQIAGIEYTLASTEESRKAHGLTGAGAYIGDDMGLGKTVESIISIVEAWNEEVSNNPEKKFEDLRAFVLAPAVSKIIWQREIERWVGSLGLTAQILRGTKPQPIWANFVICNPELLRKELNEQTGLWEPMPLFTILLGTRWFAIVADEAHFYKEFRAQRTGNALEMFSGKRYDPLGVNNYKRWRLPVPMRIMLSGSPILNRPGEYISQLEALGLLDQFGGAGRYYTEYCSIRHLNKIERVKRLKELHRKLRQRGYLRREKETMVLTPEQEIVPLDTLSKDLNLAYVDPADLPSYLESKGYKLLSGVLGQLPPKIRTYSYLPISNRIVYKKAEQDFLKWMREELGDDELAEEKLNRAARGYALVMITTLKRLAEEGKVKAAIKWIKDFMLETGDQKLVFFTSHLKVQDNIHKAFPQAAIIRGGQTPELRQAQIDRFQTDPDCRLILCMLQAGGQSITLTAAHHLAFLSLGWNPATHDQAEDRIWGRINDLHGASVYYLLADRTIDSQLARIIDAKREVTTAVSQGADVPTHSTMVELLTFYRDKAIASGWAEIFGIEDEEGSEDDVA